MKSQLISRRLTRDGLRYSCRGKACLNALVLDNPSTLKCLKDQNNRRFEL